MFSLKKERINFKKKIGSGASGTVYPYQKNADDLKWVVKRILADDSDKLLTYLPEIVLGFSCDHPCIVPLKGYSIEKMDQEGYSIYLKFPRMKETLKEKFDRQKKNDKPFSEEELVKYFYAMVCAVDYLHKKKIYHRDIKPGNVLLDDNGNAMLSDVGVAKHVGEEEIYQPLTGQGGTVDYTAPELLKDKSKLTKENLIAGDAWSLGLVMLELCVLKNRLFNPYSVQEKIEEVQKSLYDKLMEIYSKTLLELIFKLLKFESNERITISDLKQTLETEFHCCLNSELNPENSKQKNKNGIENVDYPPENDKKSDLNATQETIELVENLLRENSQLQNQLKEHISFFNKFQEEMGRELKMFENENVKNLLANYQDTLKKLNLGKEIVKYFQSEISPIQKQHEESLLERNKISQSSSVFNESDREERKELQKDHTGKSQAIALGEKISGRNKFIYQETPGGDVVVNIVVIGPSNDGKTVLIRSLVSKPLNLDTSDARGIDFLVLTLDRDEKRLKFKIWDTCGAERFMAINIIYLRGCSGVIIVYDICERFSFDQMPTLIKAVKDSAQDSIILFIVGNKLDLSSERQVPKEEAETFARKHGAIYLEVSAKTGENLDELREQLADAFWEKYYSNTSSFPSDLPQNSTRENLPQNSTREKKKSSFWKFFG